MNSNIFSARETGTSIMVGPVGVRDFPRVGDPNPELVSDQMMEAVRSAKRGQFMLDSGFLPGIPESLTSAEFVEVHEHELTRERSAHMLMCGQLLVRSEDEGETSLHVAVKPMDDNMKAAHEYAAASYIARGGMPHCETFKPLGIMRLEDTGQPAVVSLYNNSVKSMDNVFLNPDVIHNKKIVDKSLARSAVALDTLHNNDWVHGDYQPQNSAFNPLMLVGNTFVIDVEAMKPLGALQSDERRTLKEEDVRKFIGGLYTPALDEESGFELPDGYDEQIRQHFARVYPRNRRSDVRDSLSYEDIADIIEQERDAQ